MIQNVKNQNEALTNFLRNCFTKDENYFIQNSDSRLGKKYAIAHKVEKNGNTFITNISNFMKYDEMNCFFYGNVSR